MRSILKSCILLLLFISLGHFAHAQSFLVCKDYVPVTLGTSCSRAVTEADVLATPCDCPQGTIVTMDKTLPIGNGPWVAAELTQEDIGKLYQVRVQEVTTGNLCWGTIKAVPGPLLDCNQATVVSLGPDGTATLNAAAVNVTASNACQSESPFMMAFAPNSPTMTFDCGSLNVIDQVVEVRDAGGNVATCLTPIIVDDVEDVCHPGSCVLSCPSSQEVSIQMGFETLYPAYVAGNTNIWDQFGQPTVEAACASAQLAYTTTYKSSTAGIKWFERRWEYTENSQVVGGCLQNIWFPAEQTIRVSGRVFVDSVANCVYDAGEQPLSYFKVLATTFPSNNAITVPVNADGTYSFDINVLPLASVDSILVVKLLEVGVLNTACPTVLTIPCLNAQPQYTQDFPFGTGVDCGVPTVSVSTAVLRRCFDTNVYFVRYCNIGSQPLPDAEVTIGFDPLLTLVSSLQPYTADGNVYTFSLGTLPPFFCGDFQVQVKVSCDAVLSQTLCVEANISSSDTCGEEWSGARIAARATCTGDLVRLVLENIGQQSMTESAEYIVVEDILMRDGGQFQLDAGDSTVVTYPANGATWRIEGRQVTGYPYADRPIAVVEACGGLNTPGLVNAFMLNEESLDSDIECMPVVGSFDPNDKAATPIGHSEEHFIVANTDLEYKIRFQNTGTDTAFTVVVVDSLSEWLQPGTVEAGASSHPYRLEVPSLGILRFVFENILLPDSNVNQAGSNGFLTFRVKQRLNLPDGIRIENSAAIYFDFNEPIITNTVFHTIGKPYVSSVAQQPARPGISVAVRPNPFEDAALVEIRGYAVQDGLLRLYDARGLPVCEKAFNGQQCSLERLALPAGVYFYQITDGGMAVCTGEVMVR
jgi:uncharacterized repeat protein (TIGR01451 family)